MLKKISYGFWLTLTALLMLASTALADSTTKISTLLDTRDKLIVKNHYNVGTVAPDADNAVTIDAIVYYEFGMEAQKLKGLWVSINNKDEDGESIILVDLDEVGALSKGLDNMASLARKMKETKTEYFEAQVLTKEDLKIGFYQVGNDQRLYIKKSGYSEVGIYLAMDDLAYVKSLIDKSAVILAGK
jgi:hypothetical protein